MPAKKKSREPWFFFQKIFIFLPAAMKVAPATSSFSLNFSQMISRTGTKKSSQMAPNQEENEINTRIFRLVFFFCLPKPKIRYVANNTCTITPP